MGQQTPPITPREARKALEFTLRRFAQWREAESWDNPDDTLQDDAAHALERLADQVAELDDEESAELVFVLDIESEFPFGQGPALLYVEGYGYDTDPEPVGTFLQNLVALSREERQDALELARAS